MTIDCASYRRALLADPQAATPELDAHRAACPDCAAWTTRLHGFEGRLARVLAAAPAGTAVDAAVAQRDADASPGAAPRGEAPVSLAERRNRRSRPGRPVRRGWLAAAASVLVALALVMSLWLAAPHASLARDVVAHMAGEPQAWARTTTPVGAAQLERALKEAQVELAPSAPLVSYAQACRFRGHLVPHLVVQTPGGPVTVMVLVHERVSKPVSFEEGGYRGMLVPDGPHGSLAVLVRTRDADTRTVRDTAEEVRAALRWQG